MGLSFCLGASGSGKSTRVYQEIISRSMEHEQEEFLIIVPDQFTMQTQKELCELHPRKGIMNIDVLSFSRLAHRIFDEVYVEEKTVLDDTGKNLIIRKVASEKEKDLGIIGSNLKKIGYVHEVKSMISEFMQYGIRQDELKQMMEYGKNKGQLQAKLKDLAIIYDGFLEYIKDHYITTEESLDILRGILPKSEMIKRATVVFDGFTGFTPVQNKLIQEIMRLSKEVIVTLTMDMRENPYEQDGEHKLFHLTKKTIHSLTKLAEEAGVERSEDIIINEESVVRQKDNKTLSHLERNLFRYPVKVYKEKADNIELIVGDNPRNEIQNVCLKIKRLLREENYYYRDIAVVTGSLEQYADIVEAECKRYGIPYFLDQNLGLMFHPMIHFILGALEIIRTGFSYESVFHFMRNGLLNVTQEETDHLENYVKALGIKGKAAYENQFVRRTNRVEEESEELIKLNQTRQLIMESMEPLLRLKAVNKGEEYVTAIHDFCVKNELQYKLERFVDEFEAAGDMARAKEYGQVYRVVMDLLNQFYELLGDSELELKEFKEILTAGFSELKVSTIPPNIDQIVVGDMERTRLKNIKTLFFVGVNDGIIPKSSAKGGLISDLDREFLAESGFEMAPTKRAQMFTQKFYLYMNMTKPTERLYVSYSKVDNSGKTLRPAYLISELKNMFPLLFVGTIDMQDLHQCVETREDGYDDLAGLLCEFAAGRMDQDEKRQEEFLDFIKLYKAEEWITKLADAAFYEYKPDRLSVMTAKAVYGNMLKSSVSRLEKFAGCAYAHFVKYGLKLQPEEEFAFESVDMGTIFHDVIARFAAFLEEQGESLFTFTKETMEQFTKKTLEEIAVQYGGTILYNSARNAYIIKRMERILNRTFLTLKYQLKKGRLKPAAFEIPFEIVKEIKDTGSGDKGGKMSLIGRIDRIDKLEEDGKTYIKVMDYKSGNNKFDPVSLYYGTQMQLAVYLNAAVELEKLKQEQQGKTGEVIPAAILYYHMHDPFVSRDEEQMSEAQLEAQRYDALRMDGLVNEDEQCISMLDASFEDHSDIIPVDKKKTGGLTAASKVATTEEFRVISEFVEQKAQILAGEIMNGNKEISPYERAGKNACEYCEFSSICKFDEKVPGFKKRELDKLSPEEAIGKMREEIAEREGR